MGFAPVDSHRKASHHGKGRKKSRRGNGHKTGVRAA
jgi:hypothetical protein